MWGEVVLAAGATWGRPGPVSTWKMTLPKKDRDRPSVAKAAQDPSRDLWVQGQVPGQRGDESRGEGAGKGWGDSRRGGEQPGGAPGSPTEACVRGAGGLSVLKALGLPWPHTCGRAVGTDRLYRCHRGLLARPGGDPATSWQVGATPP